MGTHADLMHDEARQDVADALANLLAEEFAGSSALGPDGRQIAAGVMRAIAAALDAAATWIADENAEEQSVTDPDPQERQS